MFLRVFFISFSTASLMLADSKSAIMQNAVFYAIFKHVRLTRLHNIIVTLMTSLHMPAVISVWLKKQTGVTQISISQKITSFLVSSMRNKNKQTRTTRIEWST